MVKTAWDVLVTFAPVFEGRLVVRRHHGHGTPSVSGLTVLAVFPAVLSKMYLALI